MYTLKCFSKILCHLRLLWRQQLYQADQHNDISVHFSILQSWITIKKETKNQTAEDSLQGSTQPFKPWPYGTKCPTQTRRWLCCFLGRGTLQETRTWNEKENTKYFIFIDIDSVEYGIETRWENGMVCVSSFLDLKTLYPHYNVQSSPHFYDNMTGATEAQCASKRTAGTVPALSIRETKQYF